MIPGVSRQKMVEKALDSEGMDKLLGMIADTEIAVVERAARLAETLSDEPVDIEPPDKEDRVEAFRSLIAAVAAGEDELREFWAREVVSERYENADALAEWLGIDRAEWTRRMARQADAYREQGAEGTDRQLMDHHLQDKHGVGIEQFEAEIIDWEASKAANSLFGGNFVAAIQVMEAATEELADDAEGE